MKKILITFIISLVLIVLESPLCFSKYAIPDQYAPANAPWGQDYDWVGSDTTSMASLILQMIANALLYFAAPIAIAMLVFAGYTFITGGANSEKQEQAKKHLQWTILGLLAIILSYSIVRIAIFFLLSAAQQSAPPGP